MKLWNLISLLSKVNLARVYKDLTGLDFVLPEEDGRGKIEDVSEIEKIMHQKPNYPIDKQGRKE